MLACHLSVLNITLRLELIPMFPWTCIEMGVVLVKTSFHSK